jgi:hypothetical protein
MTLDPLKILELWATIMRSYRKEPPTLGEVMPFLMNL